MVLGLGLATCQTQFDLIPVEPISYKTLGMGPSDTGSRQPIQARATPQCRLLQYQTYDQEQPTLRAFAAYPNLQAHP